MPNTTDSTHPFRRKAIIALMVIGVLAGWGIISRIRAESGLRGVTEDASIPTVHVMKAVSGPAEEEVVLPGTVQAWHEASIYARTNGYVKEWRTDIGAPVETGDVLAEIETPEVDAQLAQAQADLNTAQATGALAQSTARRWQALMKTNSVSRQETDEKISDAAAKSAAVASARANLDRLRQLESFKHVTAPFNGVVTARGIDNGALINAGGGTAGVELFHIAELTRLRVYVQVPETYVAGIAPEMKAQLYFAEHPGRLYTAELVSTARALDPATRTLLVEFAVDNSPGELMPGGYTQVHIKLAAAKSSVHLPVNALVFRREGLQAAVVDADGKALLKPVTPGRDYGKEIEIVSGIAPGDMVVVNPPDSLVSGQKVHVSIAPVEDKKDGGKEPEKKDDAKKDGKSS